MKKIPLTRLFILLAFLVGASAVQAQANCDAYFPMRSGSVMELTHFNAKGKATTKTHTEIVEKEHSGTALIVQANTTTLDDKGKEVSKGSYDMICDGDQFKMDMRAMASGQPEIQGAQIEIDSDELVFPNSLKTGMELPDGNITMKVSMNGMQIMSNTIRVYNRKVVGSESKTTPAGTFDCMIIEQDTEAGMMGRVFVTHSKTWVSKGTGMVRSENLKNGELESYSELTKLVR